MKAQTRFRQLQIQIMLGLLIGLMLAPAQPVQAQLATFDKPNWLLKFEDMQREVDRWMEKVEQYNKMYDKAVKTVSNLTNILDKVEKQLARNKALVSTIAGVGKIVRYVFALRRQIENMVRCRIRAINSLGSRLRSGIFNPQENLRDLEEYLRNTIGRASQDTMANQERLANMDNEFERLRYELQLAWGRLAEAEAVLKQYENMLATEMAKPEDERHMLGFIQQQIATVKVQIEQINAQINDLTAKLAEKAKQYGDGLIIRADYGKQIENETKAWESTIPARQDILERIDREFEPDEGIDDDPADGNN